ncbi:cysteine proteinase [Serendipita vermifera]|nr:cysteine proteinase [Serendipita vermifera]
MSLLRWMGVTPQTSNPQGRGNGQPQAASKALEGSQIGAADAKRFGLENFGNTCYANSMLQALYFCEPFRELVVNSPDRSYLYPSPPPLPAQSSVTASTSTQPQSSSSTAKQPAKGDGKNGTSAHKRPISGSHQANGDARGESSSKATDADDSKGSSNNTATVASGPPIPAYPPTLFSALRSLFVHISQNTGDKGIVAPQAFISKLKKENEQFRTTMQQDAHEFLIYLINRVMEDMEEEDKLIQKREKAGLDKEKAPTLNPSGIEDLTTSIITTTSVSQGMSNSIDNQKLTFVHSLFEGTLTSETRCLTCETVSSRDEMFLDLSIDIEQNSSVTACLRQFSASEMLCQRNKFFCDSCCGLQEAEKRMKIKRLPNVLALHLKRFKYQEELGKYVKLNYRVAFPFELRLFNTVDDAVDMDRRYELYAIVVHIGGGPTHGHYITIIKAQGTWYVFDDNSVDAIKESDISKYYGDGGSGTGYVLFYQAVDLDREALGLKPEPVVPMTQTGSLKAGTGPPSPAVPISVEPSSPVNGTSGNAAVTTSPPPSPSALLINGPKIDIPPRSSSPSELGQVAGSPSASPIVLPQPSSGGFFSSLRHSRSLKAAERASASAALAPPVPVPVIGSTNANGPNATASEKDKEEKLSGGWLSFRSKEKRRDSISQGGSTTTSHSQNASSAPPSSPKPPTTPTVPSSPRVSTMTRRPSTAGTSLLEQLPPLPTAAVPLPSQTHNHTPSSAIEQQTTDRRASATDTPAVDGSDSLSGSSSWTSGVAPNTLVEIPPLPKDLPPVPALVASDLTSTPLAIPLTINTTDDVLAPPKTLTQSPSQSALSIPGTSAGDPISANDRIPVTASATISSVAGSSSRLSMSSHATTSAAPLTSPHRTNKQSIKDLREAVKAKKSAEAVAKKNKEKQEEERRRAEKAERDRERAERERIDREKERIEKEKEKEHKSGKRASRKMSLGLSGLSLWSRDKDKDKDKEKDKHTASLPAALRTGRSHATEDRPEPAQSDGHVQSPENQDVVRKALSPEGHFVPTFNF